MVKQDYKKMFKNLYLPKQTPNILTVPAIKYITISGHGNPKDEGFSEVIAALFAFSYAVKMSYRSDRIPEGYYDYTVFPLEGVWDLIDPSVPATEKNNLKYKMMMRQPEFLTPEWFDIFLNLTKVKKPNAYLDMLQLETIHEGTYCQILHIGSFDDEPASFAKMAQYCEENGCQRASHQHREIYLSDFRKTRPENLKTVLRFQVIKKIT